MVIFYKNQNLSTLEFSVTVKVLNLFKEKLSIRAQSMDVGEWWVVHKLDIITLAYPLRAKVYGHFIGTFPFTTEDEHFVTGGYEALCQK